MSEMFLKNLNGVAIGIDIKWIFTKNKEVEMAFVKANKELLKSTLNFDKGLCRIDKYERQACAFREMVERCEKEKELLKSLFSSRQLYLTEKVKK